MRPTVDTAPLLAPQEIAGPGGGGTNAHLRGRDAQTPADGSSGVSSGMLIDT